MSMRSFAIFLAVLLLAAGTAPPARAADPAKRPDDFRGVAWGTAAAASPDLKAVDRDGDIVHYERPAEKKDLGGIPLRQVTYSFYKGKFYHAEISYEGQGAFETLQKSLEAKYGPPDATRQKTDAAGHAYEVAVWTWPGHAFIGHRRDLDAPRGRIFYFYAPLTEASAKAQGTAPPRDQAEAGTGAATAGSAGGPAYTVQKGDTIERIAKRNGAAEEALLAANPGLNPRNLKIGPALTPPAGAAPKADAAPPSAPEGDATPAAEAPATQAPAHPGLDDEDRPKTPPTKSQSRDAASRRFTSYTVKSGDVLSKIAARHGVRTSDILAANPGIKADTLDRGDVLKIPARK